MTGNELIKRLGRDQLANAETAVRAIEFAGQALSGRQRLSGEPAANHGYAVGGLLLEANGSAEEVAAGIMHDLDEDTEVTLAEIESHFGQRVAWLVSSVSVTDEMARLTWPLNRYAYFIRLYQMAVEDPAAIRLKLADRLHNMRTIGFLPTASQERNAWENLNLLLPMMSDQHIFIGQTGRLIKQWLDELEVISRPLLPADSPDFPDFRPSRDFRAIVSAGCKRLGLPLPLSQSP